MKYELIITALLISVLVEVHKEGGAWGVIQASAIVLLIEALYGWGIVP